MPSGCRSAACRPERFTSHRSMATHSAEIRWTRSPSESFIDNRYSRKHRWRFDGGIEIPASSSPHVVPLPLSSAEAVDPEEAFVASLSSCHMLWFLSIAAKRGFVVDDYTDPAIGHLEKNAAGKLAMSRVLLRPKVAFSSSAGKPAPTPGELAALHHEAHAACFLANSVLTEITCEPQ